MRTWTARGPMYGVWEYIMKLVIGFFCVTRWMCPWLSVDSKYVERTSSRGAQVTQKNQLCLVAAVAGARDVEMYFF